MFIYYVCLIPLLSSCDRERRAYIDRSANISGIYYNCYEKRQFDRLHYIFLTVDSIYINVLHSGDSALVNVNKWHKPYPQSSCVKFERFVPTGYLWECDIWWNKDVYDSIYIYKKGLCHETDSENGLYYDPDGRYTFSKIDYQYIIKLGIIPRKFKSLEEAEAHLCIGDSSIFEGIRKVSKAELRTMLWGE